MPRYVNDVISVAFYTLISYAFHCVSVKMKFSQTNPMLLTHHYCEFICSDVVDAAKAARRVCTLSTSFRRWSFTSV